MKRILLVCLIAVLASCDADSNSSNGNSPDGIGGSLARFSLVGNYLYTVDDQSLRIFDISNPAVPTFSGEKFIGFDIETLYSLDQYLFVGSRLGMYILIFRILNFHSSFQKSNMFEVVTLLYLLAIIPM